VFSRLSCGDMFPCANQPPRGFAIEMIALGRGVWFTGNILPDGSHANIHIATSNATVTPHEGTRCAALD